MSNSGGGYMDGVVWSERDMQEFFVPHAVGTVRHRRMITADMVNEYWRKPFDEYAKKIYCDHCEQGNDINALECRKCGAPLPQRVDKT